MRVVVGIPVVASLLCGCASPTMTTRGADVSTDDADGMARPADAAPAAPVALTVTPRSVLVFVDPWKPPPTVRFHTTLAYDDGTSRDVTTSATYTVIDPSLGSVVGPLLTLAVAAPEAGISREGAVRARMDPFEATATVNALYAHDGDAAFAMGACPDAVAVGNRDAVVFESHGRTHSAHVLADENAPFIARLEAIHREGCSTATIVDRDGYGIGETFEAPAVGDRLCYRVVPGSKKLYEARKDVTTFFAATVVEDDGGEVPARRNVILIVAPKLGVPC